MILPVIRITYVEGWNVKKNAYFLYLCKYIFPMTKCFHFIVLPAFKKLDVKVYFTYNFFFFLFQANSSSVKTEHFLGFFLKVCVQLTDPGIRRRTINMIHIRVVYLFWLEELSGNNFPHSI